MDKFPEQNPCFLAIIFRLRSNKEKKILQSNFAILFMMRQIFLNKGKNILSFFEFILDTEHGIAIFDLTIRWIVLD